MATVKRLPKWSEIHNSYRLLSVTPVERGKYLALVAEPRYSSRCRCRDITIFNVDGLDVAEKRMTVSGMPWKLHLTEQEATRARSRGQKIETDVVPLQLNAGGWSVIANEGGYFGMCRANDLDELLEMVPTIVDGLCDDFRLLTCDGDEYRAAREDKS